MAVKNKLVLRWSQRAHCWFWGGAKGHIRGPKGHSALWKRPSENPGPYIINHTLPQKGVPSPEVAGFPLNTLAVTKFQDLQYCVINVAFVFL